MKIPRGQLVAKARRGFVSVHGWRLGWLMSLVAKIARRFDLDDSFLSSMGWFLCCEVSSSYLFNPTDRALRTCFTSVINRFACHLFEEGAGIYHPQRVVLFKQVFDCLGKIRAKIESTGAREEDQSEVFLCVVCLFILSCTSPQKGRLVSLYKVVVDNRNVCLKLMKNSKEKGDQELVEELGTRYPEKKKEPTVAVLLAKKQGKGEKGKEKEEEEKREIDPYYAPLLAFFNKTKNHSKNGWVGELKKYSKEMDGRYPTFSECVGALAAPWFSKRDKVVWHHGPILSVLRERFEKVKRKECAEEVLEEKKMLRQRGASALELTKSIVSFVSRTAHSASLEKFLSLLSATDYGKKLDWVKFVEGKGETVPEVVLDKHTGAKGKSNAHFALFASVVPGHEKWLSEDQVVLLGAYERCHLLRDPAGAKREKGKEGEGREGKEEKKEKEEEEEEEKEEEEEEEEEEKGGRKRKREEEIQSEKKTKKPKKQTTINYFNQTPAHWERKKPLAPPFTPLPVALEKEMVSCYRGQRSTG